MTSNDAALQTDDPFAIFLPYFILFNVIVVLVLPILEELAFHRIFTDIWFKPDRKWLFAVITLILFSLVYGFDNFIAFLMYLIMGMILFYAYYRIKNIKDAILVHVLNNTPSMVVSFVSYVLLYIN
ncbi:hypothetical protein IGI39_004579 [Enterococcus sp. AZ135]|uniref:CPBP family intramembrane glutamic endopeptidase n=1 Tax=unclassified Enterococcus TaxID=2608891 RepID=UPI003F20B474